MDLQELITRGRFALSGAPIRIKIFELVNGKRTAPAIAKQLGRHVKNVSRDLGFLRDAGLIEARRDQASGDLLMKDRALLYQKVALARTVPIRYFREATSARPLAQNGQPRAVRHRRPARPAVALALPSETEILDVCKDGEDQTHEFKAARTDVKKVVREIAAMANTRQGGMILYGIADDGTVEGSDLSRQKFDQPLQNSVRSNIAPALVVRLHAVDVMGSTILVIVVPPWNRRDVYQFEERVLIRKGTNVFAARPEESRKLHAGRSVV